MTDLYQTLIKDLAEFSNKMSEAKELQKQHMIKCLTHAVADGAGEVSECESPRDVMKLASRSCSHAQKQAELETQAKAKELGAFTNKAECFQWWLVKFSKYKEEPKEVRELLASCIAGIFVSANVTNIKEASPAQAVVLIKLIMLRLMDCGERSLTQERLDYIEYQAHRDMERFDLDVAEEMMESVASTLEFASLGADERRVVN